MKNKKILVIDKEKIEYLFNFPFFSYDSNIFKDKNLIDKLSFSFIERNLAENDISKKQIIPYIILKDRNDRFFTYKRKGNEKRLHGLYSLGVGGHIDLDDLLTTEFNQTGLNDNKIISDNLTFNLDYNSFSNILKIALSREILEETGININKIEIEEKLKFLGIINEDISSVGKVHLGFVYLFNLNMNQEIKPIDDEINSFKYLDKSDLTQIWDNLERWSILSLSLLNINKTIIYIGKNRLETKDKSYFFENFGITEFIEYIIEENDVEKFSLFLQFLFTSKDNSNFFYFVEDKFNYIEYSKICEQFNLKKIE